jgi:hypothetical protein
MKLLNLGVCIAWAAVAISSASPVDAKAATSSTGNYAACGPDWNSTSGSACGYTLNYTQRISMISMSCGSGGCSSAGGVGVESVYLETGRKVASLVVTCAPSMHIYNLTSCTC